MIKSGQTANGVAHFAPMMELQAPQWNMRNPFNDLIGIALKEREMELKEKEMGLKEKGLGLDEQKFAYGAANDEVNRQHAIELANIKAKGDRENLNLRYQLVTKQANRLEAKENLEDAKVEEVRRYAGQIYDNRLQSGEKVSRMESFNQIEDFLRSIFGNKYVDRALVEENNLKNYKATQNGGGLDSITHNAGF